MPRPFCYRRIGFLPGYNYFKPRGIPAEQLQEIDLTLDELEAVRLADLNGMYQEQAAQCMNISRATFGRILESAHRKIAEALIMGKVLRFQKGIVEITDTKKYRCYDCKFEIDVPYQAPNIIHCPQCGGKEIQLITRRHRKRHWKGGPPLLK